MISRERAETTLLEGIDSFGRHGFGFWTAFEKSGDELIGFCGLRFIAETRDVEVLYAIQPRLWGRGLATEAARAVLRWGFRETGLQRIFAGTDPPNLASVRVIEKIGMRFHGRRTTAAGQTPYWVIEREEFLAADPAPRDNPD